MVNGSNQAVLDFRIKSYLSLPRESRYILDICDKKGTILGSIDLRQDVSSNPNSQGIGPGRNVPYSCGPFTPAMSLSIKALDDKGNLTPDLRDCICQIYDGNDWPTNHYVIMSGSSKAEILIPINKYLQLQKPLKLKVYLTNNEVSAGKPSWSFPISDFGDAEFIIRSEGTCSIRVQAQENAKKDYAGCLAVLKEKENEKIGNQFITLYGSGRGTFKISIEKLKRMGWPDKISVYGTSVTEDQVNWGEASAKTEVAFNLQPGVLAKTIYLAKPLEGGPGKEQDSLTISNVDESGAISIVQYSKFHFRNK